MQHAELVDLSESIARNIGLRWHWPDPIPPWGRGEHPDRFGLFDRYCPEIWRDDEGAAVEVRRGDTFLFECKASPADYRQDAGKEWRQPGAISIGNFRAFVAPIGIIDVTDLIGTPWGLWEVDDAGEFDMTRAPQRIHKVNRVHELMLLAKLADVQAPAQRKGGGRAKAATLGAFDEVESLLAQQNGSLPIGRIRRLLGIKTQPDKLADQLKRDVRFNVETECEKSWVSLAADTQIKEAT